MNVFLTCSLWKWQRNPRHINGEEPRKDNVTLSEQMDIMLIDALLEQQVNGNRVDGTFTTTAYNNFLQICRDKLNYPFDKDHLKNRLKTNFNICHDLFKGLSGCLESKY